MPFAHHDGDRIAGLYESLNAPTVRTDVASAEMIKLASNAALATRISFINEIANVCGGSCFPKDALALKQLAANSGYHFQLLSAVIDVNELQKRRIVKKIQAHLGALRGRTVAILGLSFKPNTNDMREAPSLVLAPRLLAEGAVVRVWDPVALPAARKLLGGVDFAETLLEAVEDADAALIVTEWPELHELVSPEVRQAMRTPLIVDGRNMLDPAKVQAGGFVYESIGRPSAVASDLVHARGIHETSRRDETKSPAFQALGEP